MVYSHDEAAKICEIDERNNRFANDETGTGIAAIYTYRMGCNMSKVTACFEYTIEQEELTRLVESQGRAAVELELHNGLPVGMTLVADSEFDGG